jgi:lipopolysaccharide/colanic/teichoic acid biosynthesis glycosyltransferase
VAKRALDLLIAVPALVLLSPVLGVIALLVRTTLGKRVLFRQRRPGFHGRPFTLYKFRTMRHGRDATGQPLPDPHRLTRLGRFLRRTSFDELPELWNVIRGDMSLVGPRPLLMEYLDRYTPEQERRHEVKPGITGWTQLNGRNALTWEEKFRLDVWYVDNRSLLLDCRILIRTLWKVITGEGVNPPGSEQVEVFRGRPGPERAPKADGTRG